jgi:lysozyme
MLVQRLLKQSRMRATLIVLLCAGCGAAGVDPVEEAATVCAAGATTPGIDVSHYQGTIDFAKVAAAGKKFVIVKATESTGYIDPSFAGYWADIKKAGMIRGAYHFFRANVDATAQANYFVNTVGQLGADDLPPMLDLETTDGESAATIASRALTWLQVVEKATGKKPILYTYVSFWQSTLGQPSGFQGYPLNIANYGVTCPQQVGSWPAWTMWQYSSTGSVSGISGDVDEDYFNGDLASLQKFAGGSGSGNPCLGLVDGSYCGGDGLAGDKGTLYVCKGGMVDKKTVCGAGCKFNPPGTPDACNPDPTPMPDGGTGSGSGGSGGGGTGGGSGGGSGGGGAADNPGGGVGVGGGGEMMPSSASSGCSMGGTSSNGWLPLFLVLAVLAVRRARLPRCARSSSSSR